MRVVLKAHSSSRDETLQCLERLPKLSPMMTQLLARLSHRNCDVRELVDMVGKDALLSAQMLRLANSAAFGRSHAINSVGHAVALIGVGTMRKFVLASSISNLFARSPATAPSFSMTRFNLHSVATATLVELLSDEVPLEAPSSAFIAGLLHDVGKLLLAVSRPQQFESVLAYAAVKECSLLDSEREIFGTDHTELSAMAVSRWELPAPVQWAARYHHEPELAAEVEGTGPGNTGLSLAVHEADAFINYLGMSVLQAFPQSGDPPRMNFPGRRFSQERVLGRFESELKNLGDLFR